jgi:hypothetical protein
VLVRYILKQPDSWGEGKCNREGEQSTERTSELSALSFCDRKWKALFTFSSDFLAIALICYWHCPEEKSEIASCVHFAINGFSEGL